MPDPAGTYSDGALVWGSQVVTIPTTSGIAYIAENISTDAGTKVLTSMNENGVPNKEVLIEEVKTGSATLQLAAETTVVPPLGAAFTLTPIGAGTVVQFKVSKVGETHQQDGETKVSIEFRKKLNA